MLVAHWLFLLGAAIDLIVGCVEGKTEVADETVAANSKKFAAAETGLTDDRESEDFDEIVFEREDEEGELLPPEVVV